MSVLMTKTKFLAVGATALTVALLLTASVSVDAASNSNKSNKNKSNSNATVTAAKALGKSKWNVTKGTITAVDLATKIVTAQVKNSNRKALRNTTVVFTMADGASIRLGQSGFLRVEGLVVNAGKRVTLDKILPGDTLLLASGTSDGAGVLTAKKLWVKRTACQINGAVTAVDTAADPDTMTLTVGNASKNTGLAGGASATVDAVTGAKVKRDGVTATWGDVQVGDVAAVKCYLTLDGTTKEFHATRVNAKSPGFLSNLNANANGNSNTNS